MNRENPNVPHDYRVIAVDETNYWDESITKLVGRIAGIYLVDLSVHHYLCEMTPSYRAVFIQNITEKYYREPDGHGTKGAIWDSRWLEDGDPDEIERSKTLYALGIHDGLEYENGGETEKYYSSWGFDKEQGSKITKPEGMSEEEFTEEAALDAVQEYISNGEDWSDLAPWKPKPEDANGNCVGDWSFSE